MTKTVLLMVATIVGVGILVQVLKRLAAGGPAAPTDDSTPWPYVVVPMLGAAEQDMLRRLVDALPECLVFAQVQVSRVLRVSGQQGKSHIGWLNKLNQMSFDFVICGKDAMPIAAIEVDDSTHARPDRKKADAKKDRACHDAGLKLVRWSAGKLPEAKAIRARLLGSAEMASPTDSNRSLGREPVAAT